MTLIDKIDRLLVERYSGPTVTVTWELCDPKDWDGDTCTEVDINLGFYHTPEEKEMGYIRVPETFELETVEFAENITYMGKKYRYGQAFPKQLRKHVMQFRDPVGRAGFKKGNWESFVNRQLYEKLDVEHRYIA